MHDYDASMLKKNIKAILYDRRMTQNTLAENIGVPQARISRILSDKTSDNFTISQLVDISEFFGVSVDVLLFGQDRNYKDKEEKKLLSIKDVCSMLIQIDEAVPFCIELNEFEEIATHPDPLAGEDSGQVVYKKINIVHPQIYFLEHETSDELGANDFYFVESWHSSQRTECLYINEFLKKYLKIRALKNDHIIDNETFEDIINSHLSRLDDRAIFDRKNPYAPQNFTPKEVDIANIPPEELPKDLPFN